jgi:hypothetical protein
MPVVHVIAETRNKSISATTLHTMMNIHMGCMVRGKHLDIHFVQDKATLPKVIKNGERIIWMEYGTNIDNDSINKALDDFGHGLNVLVFPAVKEGINWDRFVKRTKAGSTEPAHQRGLDFDTIVGRPIVEGQLYDCLKTSARVWAMDAKPVDKKLRGGKVPIVLPLNNNEAMFDCLKKEGIKIGVLSTATVICHHVHECLGNILEASGVQVNP